MTVTENASSIVEFTRLYLAVFYTFVAIFYTTRIVMMKRRKTGELVFPGERFCSTWWNHMLFRLFRATIWMVCLARYCSPSIDTYLGAIPSLQTFPIILCGNILLSGGFLLTILIHSSMGDQWRSGIDPKGPGQLMTGGFYKYSRNPMFMSIACAQVGFFLALPCVFSLTCLIVGLSTLYKQIVAEERHLAETFPDSYHNYASNTRRWL